MPAWGGSPWQVWATYAAHCGCIESISTQARSSAVTLLLRVQDGDDGGVGGGACGRLELAGGRAQGDEDEVALAGAEGVDRDELDGALLLGAHPQELEVAQRRSLDGGDGVPGHAAELHRVLLMCARAARRPGRAGSRARSRPPPPARGRRPSSGARSRRRTRGSC